eukprot:COSAG06_NODE_21888_length_741_cov_259.853583_1_plen_70_part_10
MSACGLSRETEREERVLLSLSLFLCSLSLSLSLSLSVSACVCVWICADVYGVLGRGAMADPCWLACALGV